ncbi:MAG: N5-glutamine methyltransferase family protein, partial [Gemmatimonadales bacterium]
MPDVLRRASIAEALARATERLACAGLPHARRDATGLWAAIAGVKPGDVWLARGLEPDAAVADRFWAAVERRAAGVPFAYAVGRVGFRSLDLAIDRRALIPRPETEGLVDLVLGRAAGGLAADVGTGSGCLALALAMEGNFARVVAVERSAAAAALARENLARLRPALRAPVEIREGDLLAPLTE